ncbi:uncharacterized protein LOC143036079 [Oratosquilla oratoria]|uniref:uncharacterized protein LOC143036079 n=1 Tax=Oratosquilla oratoria TaxID=337810 RepID=UPI003F76EDFF
MPGLADSLGPPCHTASQDDNWETVCDRVDIGSREARCSSPFPHGLLQQHGGGLPHRCDVSVVAWTRRCHSGDGRGTDRDPPGHGQVPPTPPSPEWDRWTITQSKPVFRLASAADQLEQPASAGRDKRSFYMYRLIAVHDTMSCSQISMGTYGRFHTSSRPRPSVNASIDTHGSLKARRRVVDGARRKVHTCETSQRNATYHLVEHFAAWRLTTRSSDSCCRRVILYSCGQIHQLRGRRVEHNLGFISTNPLPIINEVVTTSVIVWRARALPVGRPIPGPLSSFRQSPSRNLPRSFPLLRHFSESGRIQGSPHTHAVGPHSSMGSMVGYIYCATFPELVTHYIGIEALKPLITPVELQQESNRYTIEKFLELEGYTTRSYTYEEAVERMVRGYMGAISTESCKILLKRGLAPSPSGQGFIYSRDPRTKLANLDIGQSDKNVLEYASNIRCHVLNVKAKQGVDFEPLPIYKHAIEALQKTAASAKFVEIEGAHYVHLNNPEKDQNLKQCPKLLCSRHLEVVAGACEDQILYRRKVM